MAWEQTFVSGKLFFFFFSKGWRLISTLEIVFRSGTWRNSYKIICEKKNSLSPHNLWKTLKSKLAINTRLHQKKLLLKKTSQRRNLPTKIPTIHTNFGTGGNFKVRLEQTFIQNKTFWYKMLQKCTKHMQFLKDRLFKNMKKTKASVL